MLKVSIPSLKEWREFFIQSQDLVYKYIITKKLTPVIENNEYPKDGVEVVELKNNQVLRIELREIEPILNAALKVFIEKEEYEYAGKTKKLIDAHRINTLLKEVSKGV